MECPKKQKGFSCGAGPAGARRRGQGEVGQQALYARFKLWAARCGLSPGVASIAATDT